MLGVLICVAAAYGICKIASWLGRSCAQRTLNRAAASPRQPKPPRVAPPPRMMLAYREMPWAVWAYLDGRRSRARLRLILAARREKALDRYYARLGELLPEAPADDELQERVSRLEQRARQLADERRSAFEDDAQRWTALFSVMFGVPPMDIALPVIHLSPGASEHTRRRWEQTGYQVRHAEVGHPIGRSCDRCSDVADRVADRYVQHSDRSEYARYLQRERGEGPFGLIWRDEP